MDEGDETGEHAPAPGSSSSRRGVLRRLLDGLRGETPPFAPAGDPTRLGRYRILERLGQGGMGVVFAAHDDSLGRKVAVKTIAEPDESARQRFRREARAAAGVNHPNVCQVYEIGEEGGQLFIAMELLEGEPLSGRIARGPMPVKEAIAVGRGILSALGALHATNIVHRDLKPSNVFLTTHGVKLLDFGLARPLPRELTVSLETGADLTRPGMILGTPRYMAPEQVVGHEVDRRTDLFALAAILYEVAAGRPAFLGSTVVEVLSATLHEEPPALSGDAAAAAFDRVLRRALAKRAADRPSSAEEMARDLDGIPTAADAASAAVARPLTRLVVLPFRILRPDPEVDFLSFALADAVSTSLSGLPALVLRSSASAARFAVEAPDLKALATQADVDVVLMGTLLRAGDQLRATAQLVETPGGTLVSSQVLQAPVGDLFRLQDELSQRIVLALSPSLSGRGAPRPRGAPASARAYEFYLRANEVARDWTHLAVARDLYRQCVEEDPAYAPGWAKLGRCHRLLAKYHLDRPHENLEVAEAAFRKALTLDPDLPLANKLYAHHEAEMGRAPGALRRLLDLARSNHNDPELFAGLVHACRYCGLLDASEAAHREATRLDPHAPTSVVFTWWARGNFADVIREASDEMYVQLRALALHALDRTAEAADLIRVIEARRSRAPVLDRVGEGVVAMLAGRPDAAAALRATVAVHTDPEALYLYGLCQARVGDGEAALETLTRAIEGGYLVPEALQGPWLASLRGPRLDALKARAETGRAEAQIAFEAAGGPALLGVRRGS